MEGIKSKNKSKKNKEIVKDFKGTWKKILHYISFYKFNIIMSLGLSLICSVVSIFSPKLSGCIINLLSEGVPSGLMGGGIDFESILRTILILFIMYSSSAIASCLSNYINTNISVNITYRARKEMSEKISRLPLSYFDNVTYGEVISRVTNDIDALASYLTQGISQILSSIALLLGIIYMMFSISWEMSLVSFSTLPVLFIFISIIFKISRKYFHQYQKQLGFINGHIEEIYSGHSVVRAFNGEHTAIKKFEAINNKMYNLEWKSEFISGFISPIMGIVSSLSYIGLCVLGGYLAVVKGLTIGNIFAFISYSNQFMSPLMAVSGISGILQQIAVAAERVFEFMEENENPPDKENCIKVIHNKEKNIENSGIYIKGDVEFKNINFNYNKEKTVIKNFSLNVNSGQTVAIVGPTGAGKTTLIKLLTRFYDAQSGYVLIDGYDIKEFKRRDLNSLFGVVFQEPWLFNGTVRENIRYGNVKSCDDNVEKAAKLAYADDFINSLPNGYDTVIDESYDNISYGEKQLITIARAILADHEILILDEATSAIDTMTELKIQKALKSLLKGRTAFVVAHRLSTIRKADLIVFIDNGNIIESGTHDELVKIEGMYYKMYMSQFQYKTFNN